MFGFSILSLLAVGAVLVVLIAVLIASIHRIGPTEVGLVEKKVGLKKLADGNVVALAGEAGYQADLLMPGLRFKLAPIYLVRKFPWVHIPAGQIGVVIAQVGHELPQGAKSAVYKGEFGNFTDLRRFVSAGGQKGVQRPVFPPGTTEPVHPVGFLVLTKDNLFGLPIDAKIRQIAESPERVMQHFDRQLEPEDFNVVTIGRVENKPDTIGIVTVKEGDPLPAGDIACRLGGFADVEQMERSGSKDSDVIEVLLANQNQRHNNYQDFQAFLDAGGRIGLQYDPLLYGTYTLNPFLVRVEKVPMLVVDQGQVAVIKSYVGLSTQDTSGEGFKYGSIVRPGHRGIWQEPLRTGKYPLNPFCYQAEVVPTAILTLNWAERVSAAHKLDQKLEQIVAKSSEGFIFKIDLQVQIHIPDTRAPRVISIVGTISNLVDEVLQAAVGNHFRDTLQSMPAVRFIETRRQVQEEALEHIAEKLQVYDVETRGVYIQDVILPEELVQVLTQREIAKQEIETFRQQKAAQETRIAMEQAKGTADMQAELAKSKVGVDIETNNAEAIKAKAGGEATYVEKTGLAKGAEVRAVGLARAEGYRAQVDALGQHGTTAVNVIEALAHSQVPFMPHILVAGGNGAGGGLLEALAASLVGKVDGSSAAPAAQLEAPAARSDKPAAPPEATSNG